MQKGHNILNFFVKGLNSENYLSAINAASGRKNGWHQWRQYVASFECQNSGEMEEVCETVSKSTVEDGFQCKNTRLPIVVWNVYIVSWSIRKCWISLFVHLRLIQYESVLFEQRTASLKIRYEIRCACVYAITRGSYPAFDQSATVSAFNSLNFSNEMSLVFVVAVQ